MPLPEIFPAEKIRNTRAKLSLLSRFRTKDITDLFEGIERTVHSSNAYPGVRLETTDQILKEAVFGAATCAVEHDKTYQHFLIVVDKFLKETPHYGIFLLNDGLSHFSSLLRNVPLLEEYLNGRRQIAQEYFSLDKDQEDYSFPEPSETVIKFCTSRQPQYFVGKGANHPFFSLSLVERLGGLAEIIPLEEKEEFEKLFVLNIPGWLEEAYRHGEAACNALNYVLLNASLRTYPLGHERFFSLGRNLGRIIGNNKKAIPYYKEMSVYEDHLLKIPFATTTSTGISRIMENELHVDRFGFNVLHEAARFVPYGRHKDYFIKATDFIRDMTEKIILLSTSPKKG